MAKIKLTKRKYLGEGYIHSFKNDVTGKMLFVPITKVEYERLGEKGGAKFNPTLEGHTWIESMGGTYKVDTENTILGDGDYTEVNDEFVVNMKDSRGIELTKKVKKDMVVNDEIEKTLWQ